jgi:hypothetical protein
MNLTDLDRKPVTWRYDRWDQDVVFRPISAADWARLVAKYEPHPSGDAIEDHAVIRNAQQSAELLELSVVSHVAKAEEWLTLSKDTFQTLALKALEINGLLADQAKKN